MKTLTTFECHQVTGAGACAVVSLVASAIGSAVLYEVGKQSVYVSKVVATDYIMPMFIEASQPTWVEMAMNVACEPVSVGVACAFGVGFVSASLMVTYLCQKG